MLFLTLEKRNAAIRGQTPVSLIPSTAEMLSSVSSAGLSEVLSSS